MRDNQFNSESFVFFILDPSKAKKASFGFRAQYTDREGVSHKVFLDRIDKNTGEKMVKKYSIQKGHGSLRINKSMKDEIDFLRNHPNCKDSPNGFYIDDGKGSKIQSNVWFTELNTERDAEEGLKAKEIAWKAQDEVMKLSKDTERLFQLAAVMGYTGPEKVVLFKLIEHAQKMPTEILEEVESPSFESKALFRDGVAKKVIVQKGIVYTLEDFELGIDEDSCMKTIASDKDVAALIKKKLGIAS